MNTYTVSFFGHRHITDYREVEQKLEQVVHVLLNSQAYVEFLVGRDGAFDLLAASVVKRMKRMFRDDNSALVCILPYMKADFRKNRDLYLQYYDEIEVFDSTHYMSAYQKRNEHMVDRSDLVVCCVQRSSGGAYQAMHYAKAAEKRVLNLAD